MSDHALAAEAQRWLDEIGVRGVQIVAMPGDVSPRRYYRLSGERPAILALYPEAMRESCARFLASDQLLRSVGVRVPRILSADLERGMMLLEDLGEGTLYDWRAHPWEDVGIWLECAVETIEALAKIPLARVAALSAPLDAVVFRRELAQTREVFFAEHLAARPALLAALDRCVNLLSEELGAQPVVACHRDFMARNLVPLADGALAVLDHQDLRPGPASYDLASLLNDSLFPPAAMEAVLLHKALGLRVGLDQYRAAAVQRGFKAVGTFVSFARRGSRRHLPLVEPTLQRALSHLARIDPWQGLAEDLSAALAESIWYTG